MCGRNTRISSTSGSWLTSVVYFYIDAFFIFLLLESPDAKQRSEGAPYLFCRIGVGALLGKVTGIKRLEKHEKRHNKKKKKKKKMAAGVTKESR